MSKFRPSSLSGMATVAVLLLAVIVGGCGSSTSTTSSSTAEPKSGGVLRLAENGDPESLDPPNSISPAAVDIVSQINESLFRVNEEGGISPLLATDFQVSSDGLTYAITLRKGVSFSSGKPLTSSDVVFSLEKARKSPYYPTLFAPVEKIEATSPAVVTITTSQPMAALEADLSLWICGIVPANYGGASQEEFAKHPVGTGPFKLKSWAVGQQVVLERNPTYWDKGKPYLDEVILKSTKEDTSRLAQLRGGEVDGAVGLPLSQLTSLEQSGTNSIAESMSRVDIAILNTQGSVFADPRAREAFDLAIDREGIVSGVLAGHGEPGGSFLPPVVADSVSDLVPPHDQEKAQKLLAEAKADGVDPTFKLKVFAGESYASLAGQVLQQDLEEVGFKVTIEPLDASASIEGIEAGDFGAALYWYYPASPDPSELVSFYLGTAGPWSGTSTKEIEALDSKASRELDPAARAELYREIQQIVAAEKGIITVDYQPQAWVTANDLAGFEVNPMNVIWLAGAGFTS